MTSMVKIWAPSENYWEIHPMTKDMRAFKFLYNRDKSKNKKESSKLMWAIAMCVDPHQDNAYKNMPIKTKRNLIADDHLGDPKFDWEHPEIVGLCDTYIKHCLTLAEKELIRYEAKLVQRGEFIDKVDYTMDSYDEHTKKVIKGTADQLDKMMLNSSKIFAEIDNIKEKLAKEEMDGQLKGGATESAAESGLL